MNALDMVAKTSLSLILALSGVPALAQEEIKEVTQEEAAHSAEQAQNTPDIPVEIAAIIAGCNAEDFVRGGTRARIGLGGPRGYTPRCLRVPAGSVVTIEAVGFHPVQAMAPIADIENPFQQNGRGSTKSVTRRLDQRGLYGFFCPNHGSAQGNGMAGVILVQ